MGEYGYIFKFEILICQYFEGKMPFHSGHFTSYCRQSLRVHSILRLKIIVKILHAMANSTMHDIMDNMR